MERYTMFLHWKNQYYQNDYTSQGNLQIQWNPYQTISGIFHRNRTTIMTKISNLYGEKTNKQTNKQIAKEILRKKNKVEESGSLTSDYTTKLQ